MDVSWRSGSWNGQAAGTVFSAQHSTVVVSRSHSIADFKDVSINYLFLGEEMIKRESETPGIPLFGLSGGRGYGEILISSVSPVGGPRSSPGTCARTHTGTKS